MTRVVAVNGSPRMEKGNTALVLDSFIRGMQAGGAEVALFYTSRLKIKPCACGRLYCWNDKPGECCVQDEMQQIYPSLKEADILVLAAPVYIPLPGDMQNFINRMCPLLDPILEMRAGRTRARMRRDVKIRKMILVGTSGWWEIGNLDTLVRIVKELAEDASVEFAGAVLRPHAAEMKSNGELTAGGSAVLEAAKMAGMELIRDGAMSLDTLKKISLPLVSENEYLKALNS